MRFIYFFQHYLTRPCSFSITVPLRMVSSAQNGQKHFWILRVCVTLILGSLLFNHKARSLVKMPKVFFVFHEWSRVVSLCLLSGLNSVTKIKLILKYNVEPLLKMTWWKSFKIESISAELLLKDQLELFCRCQCLMLIYLPAQLVLCKIYATCFRVSGSCWIAAAEFFFIGWKRQPRISPKLSQRLWQTSALSQGGSIVCLTIRFLSFVRDTQRYVCFAQWDNRRRRSLSVTFEQHVKTQSCEPVWNTEKLAQRLACLPIHQSNRAALLREMCVCVGGEITLEATTNVAVNK